MQFQRDDGFAHGRAADVKALGQRALGRQALADGKFTLRHKRVDLRGQPDIAAVRRGAAGLDVRLG
ncbi:hypothetical protein D3C72_1770300 [compost metagenome]